MPSLNSDQGGDIDIGDHNVDINDDNGNSDDKLVDKGDEGKISPAPTSALPLGWNLENMF